ncbi:MAG TPA: hypothetical protein VF407_10450, partial [Polyangiaceae bacterium]
MRRNPSRKRDMARSVLEGVVDEVVEDTRHEPRIRAKSYSRRHFDLDGSAHVRRSGMRLSSVTGEKLGEVDILENGNESGVVSVSDPQHVVDHLVHPGRGFG